VPVLRVRSIHGHERMTSKTEANLLVAVASGADANRRYLAFGIQALNEGRPEIAQLFFEAAGAEAVRPASPKLVQEE
jgi:rubrerythrin